MKTEIKSALLGTLSLLLALNTPGASVTTGDMGENVIGSGSAYVWSPSVSSLTSSLPATLTVVYGLWNDPIMLVHAYVNGAEVGTFTPQAGYFDAPSTNVFDVTSALVEGANTVKFDALGAAGDYVIGSVTLNYNVELVVTNPPPVTNQPPVTVTNQPLVTVTNDPGTGSFVRRGSSVLHYTTVTPLVPTELGSNVSASVRLSLKEQGNSARQSLEFEADHLGPKTGYFLVATLGDELDAVAIKTFVTDKQERARVRVTQPSNGSAMDFSPVTGIRAIGIQNAATQTVALATISSSPSFEYLVKRNLTPANTNGTAAGSVSLKGNTQGVNFRLVAGGLSASNTYYLALNSNIVAMTTSSASGRIGITSWPAGAPVLLDLRLLSLLDGNSNVVLSTTLPK